MKRIFLFIVFISSFLAKGQQSCSTTGTVGDVFYPNTTTTPTFATNGIQFLCGPNTVVYDTISIGCLFIHVNTGCTLFYKLGGCPQQNLNTIWLKNNSTLNIIPPIAGTTVYYEPLAVINNTASVPISLVACTSVIFPPINCSTGINEQNNQESIFLVYPNPSSSQINIEGVNFNYKTIDISIFNQLGELVLQRKNWSASEKTINASDLSIGLYFIQVKTDKGQQTENL